MSLYDNTHASTKVLCRKLKEVGYNQPLRSKENTHSFSHINPTRPSCILALTLVSVSICLQDRCDGGSMSSCVHSYTTLACWVWSFGSLTPSPPHQPLMFIMRTLHERDCCQCKHTHTHTHTELTEKRASYKESSDLSRSLSLSLLMPTYCPPYLNPPKARKHHLISSMLSNPEYMSLKMRFVQPFEMNCIDKYVVRMRVIHAFCNIIEPCPGLPLCNNICLYPYIVSIGLWFAQYRLGLPILNIHSQKKLGNVIMSTLMRCLFSYCLWLIKWQR